MKRLFIVSAFGMLCLGTMTAQTSKRVSPPESQALVAKQSQIKMLKAGNNEVTLSQKEMRPGVTVKVMQDSQGRIYKKVLKQGGSAPRIISRTAGLHKADDTSISFKEDFEEWQEDYGMNWIPDGWQKICTEANTPTEEMIAHNINNTWYVYYTGDGTWIPASKDGEKDCFIHFTYNGQYKDSQGNIVKIPAAPQDEWLISPKFTVKDGQKLTFDSSFDLGSAIDFDWTGMKYNRETIEMDLQVQVSTDDGQTWTKIFGMVDDVCSKMTDTELYDAMNMEYRSYTADMEQYAGKEVKIAFRYTNIGTGTSGNSASIDAVVVGTPMPVARYDMPDGTLLNGLSEDLYATTEAIAVMPAYTDIQWTDASNSYTDNVKWTFQPGDADGDVQEFTDRNPVIQYPYTYVGLPTLTAYNANGSDTYAWGEADDPQPGIRYGGRVFDIQGVPYGLGNYDYQHCGFSTPYFSQGHYCFGTGSDEDWGGVVAGVANLFEKPAAPLFVSKMYMTTDVLDADADAELQLNVYAITNTGSLGDVVAKGKAKISDAVADVGFYTIPFKFYTTDANGEEKDTTFILDQTALFEVTGFAGNDKVRSFAAMSQQKNHPSGKNFAYIRFNITDSTGQTTTKWYAASDALKDFYSSLLMTLDGAFSFIHTDEKDVTLPAGGGSQDITASTFYSPEDWTVTSGAKTETLGKSLTADWLTITPTFNEKTRTATLSLSAAATTAERQLELTFGCRGASQTITVRQDAATGISATGKTNAHIHAYGNTVIISGAGNIAGAQAAILTADGTLIARSAISSDGTCTLSTASIPSGVYIVKVGKKAVKLVR